jgi:hypothetical protein
LVVVSATHSVIACSVAEVLVMPVGAVARPVQPAAAITAIAATHASERRTARRWVTDI